MEKINLKNHENFVDIEGSYGAYQGWLFTEKFKKKFWSDRSCGVAAAGNVAYYLDKNHHKNLYDYESVNRRNFSLFLNKIYSYIRPRPYGIASIYSMKRGFLRFARSKNVDLRAETIKANSSKKMIIEFIKRGLKDDYPIMMLTWNTRERHLRYHWVTITGYYRDRQGRNFIVTSNWARREVFSLDKWIDEKSFYKGLIYFK